MQQEHENCQHCESELDAQKRPITVLKPQVEKRVEFVKTAVIEELQGQYRDEIIRTRLTNYLVTGSDFNLSEQEIRDFYDNPDNKRLFKVPAILGLSQIYIPSASCWIRTT